MHALSILLSCFSASSQRRFKKREIRRPDALVHAPGAPAENLAYVGGGNSGESPGQVPALPRLAELPEKRLIRRAMGIAGVPSQAQRKEAPNTVVSTQ